jgi:DNA-directed RNA polymerase I and III subunit RPAC1
MQHVSDGGLPPHLEEQRTRMFVKKAAPEHTASVAAAGAYLAMGMENTFSLEHFKKDFRIEVQSLSAEEIVFDMVGIDAAIANALRRILLSELPTMAIEKVFILNNTSMIQDEVLAHRLGLIPIRADPREFQVRQGEEDASEHNVISFRLQVKCSKARSADAASSSSSGPAGVVGSRVTSADLEWIPQGDQEERFASQPICPVHDDILIAKLRPGQEVELEAWCEKGLGKTHAKWSPVCTASYRLLPEVRIPQPIREAADERPPQPPIFDSGEATGRARASRPRPCSMCDRCEERSGWEERVQLARIKDHFIFQVESTGSLPPEVLFQEAIKVLMKKAADIATLLQDAVAGQAGA